MHEQARVWLSQVSNKIPDPGSVLEIGSKFYNGSLRDFFQKSGLLYVGVDIVPGRDVDEVGDINNPEFRNFLLGKYGAFDSVMSTETLEHTPARPLLMAMLSLLNAESKACRIVITCAGPNRAVHSFDGNELKEGEHYANVSSDQIIQWVYEYAYQYKIQNTHRIIIDVPDVPDLVDTYAFIEFVRKV